jgi:hypothetical protein
MRDTRRGRHRTFLACAIAAATMVACDTSGEEQEVEVASDSTICAVRSAGDPWWVATYPEQTGRFHFQFEATPYNNNIDAVVGVSKGGAANWTQLAAIVRFSPAGVIDVRRGGAYAADVSYPYSANRKYWVRMDIDIQAHTYTVTVTTDPNSGVFTTIATNYAFRTEQAGVTSLDAAAVYLEPSRPGSIEICDLGAIADDSTPDGCVTSTAGGGFANAWGVGTWEAMITRFTATPSTNAMDGVVGYTLDHADAYNDFAASIRFFTNGMIEARDGDTYRASNPLPYVAGHGYDFYVMLDTTTATYSVYAGEASDPYSFTMVANNFRFRPQQVNVDLVNNLATVVASPTGQVRVCQYRNESQFLSAQPSTTALASFTDGRVVTSNQEGSAIIDSAGRTLVTSPVRLSRVAIDDDGNIYNAVVSETDWSTLIVQSFTSTLQPRWTQTYATSGGPEAIGVYGNGVLGVAVDRMGTVVNIRMSDGAELVRYDIRAYQPYAVAIGPGRFAFAWRSGNEGIVEMHAVDGTKVWERRWTGNFGVDKLVMDRGGGLVFGGSFGEGGVDFGAGWYEPIWSEVPYNGYVVALYSNGALRFTQRVFAGGPESLSTDGSMIAYATTQWGGGGFRMQLFTWDGGGGQHYSGFLTLLDDSLGWISNALVASDGRVLITAYLKTHPSNGEPGFNAFLTLLPI